MSRAFAAFWFTVFSMFISLGTARADDGPQGSATVPSGSQNAGAGFISDWFSMVGKTQAEQPHWVTPLATVTPRLEQEFRYDISRQVQPNGTTVLENFDGGKGLEVIPEPHIELLLNLPPYLVRSTNGVPDGYGDVSFLMKYRFASANEEHGNYIITAFFGGSIPTGSYTNGTKEGTITPSLALGKGWGNFDAITTIGAVLPVSETAVIGRQIVWNTTLQYRVFRKIWPETEINSTFYSNGPNDGKKQTFVTPGLMLGKFPIWHRLGLTVGTGVQIAATQFHSYNHRYIFTLRLPF
jgi:hypothetical protein